MANQNLVLQLLITAKDEASAIFGKLFGYLNDSTNVVATQVRETFSDLFGGGLTSAADFEAALDAVAAKGGYTAEEMVKLKVEAERVAAQFGVTGTEAAKGLEILAAAGLNATDAIKTLPQVLALARSEGVSLDIAAERLADSLAIMGLGFEEAGRMADVLAKGANLSTTSATQLAEALANTGGIARAAGLDLETTVAALDLLAKNGIKGSAAGTALSAILTQLQNPASTASAALNALGISTRDLGGVLDALKAAGINSETAILAFGETAGPGLRALLGEGSTGLNAFTEQLRNADGAAKDAADGMSGNLKSALDSLNAAWDAVQRTFTEPVLEPLAKQADALTKAFQEAISSGAFSGLQDVIKSVAETAGQVGEALVKAFDFKAIGASVSEFATGGIAALSRVMENLTAIAGALVAGALIPLALQLKAGYTALMAFVAANQAAVAAMTASQLAASAWRAVLVTLSGPTGWILAGVAALTLLWKEEDKVKAATDALKGTTEEYTASLKKQTETANKLALIKLDEGMAALNDRLADAKDAYAEVNKQGAAYISVTQDLAFGLGKYRETITDANEIERLRLQRLLAVEEQERQVAEATRRRGLIIDELKAKQEDAAKVEAAAKTSLDSFKKAVEEAAVAHAKALKAVSEATYGTRAYADAVAEARVTEINLKAAKEALTTAEKAHLDAIQRTLAAMPLATKATENYAAVWEKNAAGIPQLVSGHKELGKGLADVARVTGEAQGPLKDWHGATVLAHQAAGDFTDGLGRMAPQILTVADQIKEYDRQIKAANLTGGDWQEGMTLTGVKLVGLKDAVQTTADKLAFLQSIQKDLPDAGRQIAEAEKAATIAKQDYNKALEANIERQERAVAAAQRGNELVEKSADLTIQQAQAELELANIKGDVVEISKAENAVTDAQIEKLNQSAAGKQKEIDAYAALIEATRLKLEADGTLNESDQAQLATMADTLAAMALEQQGLEQSAQQTRDLADAKAEAKKAAEELAAAEKQAAEDAKEHAAQAKAAGALISDAYNGAISVLSGLSDAAVAEFKRMRGETVATTDDIEALTQKTEALDRSIGRVGVGSGMVGFLTQIAADSNAVSKAFLGQAIAAENLTEQLNRIGEAGGATGGAMEYLIRQAENSGEQFRLLDQTRLDNLSAALDKANDKLREMQQATQDAQDRLAELNAELLESRGEDEKAALLRQQLDYQQALAEIENQRQTAELTGNRELLDILNQQKQVLEDINAAKTANIQADETARSNNNRTTTTASSANSNNNSGQVHTLKVEAYGRTLTATTTDNVADFLSAVERARRSAV